jgi:hypothetical protein
VFSPAAEDQQQSGSNNSLDKYESSTIMGSGIEEVLVEGDQQQQEGHIQ